jgi:hypothetical protein
MSIASGTLRRRASWPASRRRRSARPRWLACARALRDRYRRRRSGGGFLDRVLLRRGSALHRVTERWVLAARDTHPQVALTVQPLLRLRFAWSGGSTTVVHAPGARGTGVLPAGRPSAAAAAAARAPSLGEPMQVVRVHAPGPPRPAPCVRVFERARAPRETLAAPPAPRALALAGIASARAEKLRRREERAPMLSPARVLIREAAPPRAEAVASPPVPVLRAEPPARRPFPAPAVNDVAALPAPQLQALTDRVVQQIDRRLSAWRERSGLA